jgi:PEP-CTERM motif
MMKLNTFSNTTRLRTYLSLALGAGANAMAEHNAHAGVITSPVNETSINRDDLIFVNFSNGVISSGRGTGGINLGTLTGYSGGAVGKRGPTENTITYEPSNDTPATWSFVSLQPLPYGTTIDASTPWGGEQTGTSGGGYVNIDQGLSNAYYGLKFYAGEGTYNYGWMEVSTPGDDLTFGTAAVETIANTSIGAGVVTVPEPSTVALLAMAGGAAALRLLRKKKAA